MDATMQTNGSIGIITVDLGAASSVSGFAIEVFEDSAAGITFPSKVEFFYSTDNETWTSVGEGTKSGEGSVAEFALTLDSAVNASYVKVEMTCGASNWVFVSEFEAFGTARRTAEPVLHGRIRRRAPRRSDGIRRQRHLQFALHPAAGRGPGAEDGLASYKRKVPSNTQRLRSNVA